MMKPIISVIIPTYNRAAVLCRALDSVLIQKGPAFEVLVIDDGSTDETPRLLKKFPTVQSLKQENQGPASARNLGIANAQTDWFAFLDSDDEWLPGKLAAQYEFSLKHPEILIHQTEEIWIRNGVRVNAMKKHQKKSGWIFTDCLPLCIISPSAVMIHRKVIEQVGGFDETYPACEDYELWLRIASRYQVGLISEPLIRKYGGHEDQLSQYYEAMDQFRIRALVKILSQGTLDLEQRRRSLEMLRMKTEIYIEGAKKRGKIDEIEQITALLTQVCTS